MKKAHQKFPSDELLFYICIKQLDMTQDKFIEIVKYIGRLIATTKFENKVFAVGGSIRDYYMKQPIKDIDLAVELQNGGIELANFLYENGKLAHKPVTFERYGTCKFVLNAFPEDELEAVQTRKEKYTDYNSRNPETAFGTLRDDAERRDLTINAIYLNVSTGETVDLFNGLEDIENSILRTTSDPDFVFEDDPLRILRVIRFSAKLGWKIEDKTLASMTKNADRLKIISRERITEEFKKTLTAPYIGNALYYLSTTDVMHSAFGLTEFSFEKAWDVMTAIVSNKEAEKEFEIRMALLAAVYDNDFEFDVMVDSMKLDSKTSRYIFKILDFAYEFIDADDEEETTFRRICHNAQDKFLAGAALQVAISRNSLVLKDFEVFRKLCLFVKYYASKENAEYFYKAPFNGDDIMSKFELKPEEGMLIKEFLGEAKEVWFKHPDTPKEDLLDITAYIAEHGKE